MPHPQTRSQRAFTLIELIIVISILGILAAIALPRFANSKQLAQQAALATNVSSITNKVASEYARTGARPTTIEASWFMGGTPDHSQNEFGITAIEIVDIDGQEHPADKTLTGSSDGAYWYNTATGSFRARVADQGTDAATLTYYNIVNNAEETTLGN